MVLPGSQCQRGDPGVLSGPEGFGTGLLSQGQTFSSSKLRACLESEGLGFRVSRVGGFRVYKFIGFLESGGLGFRVSRVRSVGFISV